MRISSLEIKVLLLFAAGLAVNIFYTHYPARFVLALYAAGLVFEYSTKSLWRYHPTIKNSPFTLYGVNVLLGLGWVGTVLLGLAPAHWLSLHWGLHPILAIVLGIGVAGNLAEQLYYYMGLFSYDLSKKLLAFPFPKVILIVHLPLSVRLGYFSTIPIAAYLLLRWFG